MKDEFPELPGWWFEVREVSPGAYRVFGRDRAGRNVEARGFDPERMLEDCRAAAFRMLAASKTERAGQG